MSYDCDYVKRAEHIEMADELTPDICCDGCAEHCKISLRMVIDGNYSIKNGNQTLFIKPAMYVGDKKLGSEFLYERVQKSTDGIRVDFDYADKAYLYALGVCRKTCKNSKMRYCINDRTRLSHIAL